MHVLYSLSVISYYYYRFDIQAHTQTRKKPLCVSSASTELLTQVTCFCRLKYTYIYSRVEKISSKIHFHNGTLGVFMFKVATAVVITESRGKTTKQNSEAKVYIIYILYIHNKNEAVTKKKKKSHKSLGRNALKGNIVT